MNTIAVPAVTRSRKLPAPRPPNTAALVPEPKATPIPPPLPACSSTTRMRKTQAMTWTIVISVIILIPYACLYFTILRKSSAFSDAPPTRAPSMLGCAMSWAMFSPLTLPPY